MRGLAAGNLGISQSAGTTYLYSFGSCLDGAEDSLFHGPPVGYAAFNLLGYRPGYQVCIQFRLAYLLDI